MQILNLSQQLEKEKLAQKIASDSSQSDKIQELPIINSSESFTKDPLHSHSSNNILTSTSSTNLSSSSFICLNEKTFTNLIKSDLLNVTREVYVYYALNKWAEHQQLSQQSVKIDALYENLFRYIRLNGLSRDELEFILKNDKFVHANPNLMAKLNKLVASASFSSVTANSSCIPSSVKTNITNNAASSTIGKPNDLSCSSPSSLTHTNSQIASGVNKSRPSTIPREYLCILAYDQFMFFDFYKSKWDNLTDSTSCSVFNLNANPSSASSTNSMFTKKLNGYSTCCIENILYVMGGYRLLETETNQSGHSHQLAASSHSNLELVDDVYKFDPTKNEWSMCQFMPTKRAFHSALHLTSHNGEDELIFIFYGLYLNPESRESNQLAQCFHVDFYNIRSNYWDTIQLTSLLNHHFFYLYNNHFNRGLTTEPTNTDLIRQQIAQSRVIVSVKSILYILNENCIRCYEFDAAQRQFQALPYFQLPINNLNNFVISATTIVTSTVSGVRSTLTSSGSGCNNVGNGTSSGSEPSINSMLFTWYSQSNSNSSSESSNASSVSTSQLSSPLVNDNLDSDETEINSLDEVLFVKEALIYLLDTQNSIIYEFYPAKNKLKKLPNLLYKHAFEASINTLILNIKSKVYVTGAMNASNNDTNCSLPANVNETGGVECYDPDATSWSLFINKLDGVLNLPEPIMNEQVEGVELNREKENFNAIKRSPLVKNFFKLKMSLF